MAKMRKADPIKMGALYILKNSDSILSYANRIKAVNEIIVNVMETTEETDISYTLSILKFLTLESIGV